MRFDTLDLYIEGTRTEEVGGGGLMDGGRWTMDDERDLDGVVCRLFYTAGVIEDGCLVI